MKYHIHGWNCEGKENEEARYSTTCNGAGLRTGFLGLPLRLGHFRLGEISDRPASDFLGRYDQHGLGGFGKDSQGCFLEGKGWA